MKLERQRVFIDTISVDRDSLFGEIGSVIKYLSHIKNKYKKEDIYINEEWNGYEDNYFEIIVSRLETDQECRIRIEQEEKEAQREKLREQRRLESIEGKRKQEIKKQIEQLQKQL